jgi:succinyl-CoA synthetase beta subunit
MPDAAAAVTLRERLPAPARPGTLNERDSLALFASLGIPVIDSTIITDLDRPGAFDGIDQFPAVLKILSADVAHKTEAGGVMLAIPDRQALEQAARTLSARFKERMPTARLEGLVVQPMQKGLCEALVGFRRVGKLGAIVTVAVGGTLVELTRDFACARAPLDLDQAREMIEAVRGFAPIRGYRGLPRGDCEALARAVQAISQLALLPWVQDAEINPLIVLPDGQGVMAVDGLVVTAPGAEA